MIQGQNILCISSIDWDFIWQGHQQIMSTLAANHNKVLFVENTGVRRPVLRDASRVARRLRNWWRGTKGFRTERENLFVYSPLVLPFPYSRIARWVNRAIVVRAIRRWMEAVGVQHPIVWTFLPTPLVLDLIDAVEPELVVYYCIDDFEASSSGARSVRKAEDRLFREADLVFVTSQQLRDRVQRFRAKVELFPFGVDFGRFEAVRTAPDGIPADLHDIRRPIVGYVGGLHWVIDQDLVAGAARRLPDVSFVFIGPEQCDVSTLSSEPTVTLLGARPHDQLPGYIKGFDVGIVPYTFNAYTANVYPTKLNEYLAMGIPVVSTGLPEIRRFNHEHGGVIAVADNPEQFASVVLTALQPQRPGDAEKRIAVARENGWDARIEAMSSHISSALTARRSREVRWEERLRRLYRTGRRRVARMAAVLLLGYLLLFYSPFIWNIAEPLRVSDAPRRADAIVVFAGGVGESGVAGGGYQERVRHAVELYRGGYAPRLIFSSGFVFTFQEAEVMRDLAIALGVPASTITLEQRAASTLENVVHVRDILQQDDARTILLVSSPYHMRRAVLTWRRQVPTIDVAATPVPASQYYAHGRGANIEQIRGILWEYAAVAAYWWRGWL
jgi:uncharacterized SAM-binding protein YcdF (DUF218 family)/glycosyltransferase involved in cell wall biosynthesis